MCASTYSTCLQNVGKHGEKKEKMLVTSIFSFSHHVFKNVFLIFVKSRHCVIKVTVKLTHTHKNLHQQCQATILTQQLQISSGEPHSSVGIVADLRTGGRWFDPRLGKYSFRRLTIVIATGFNRISLLSVVSTMIRLESSQWLGKNIVQSNGQKTSRNALSGALAAAI